MILLTIKSGFNEILTFFAYYRAHMFACINLITKILIPSLTPQPHYSCCALINKSFPTAINMAKLIFYIYTIERESETTLNTFPNHHPLHNFTSCLSPSQFLHTQKKAWKWEPLIIIIPNSTNPSSHFLSSSTLQQGCFTRHITTTKARKFIQCRALPNCFLNNRQQQSHIFSPTLTLSHSLTPLHIANDFTLYKAKHKVSLEGIRI